MFKIYPYKVGSASVKKLKDSLNGMVIKLEGSRYRPRLNHIVINWGNSRTPNWYNDDVQILNHPDMVAIATDKLKTFEALRRDGVKHVPYTTDKDVAEAWLVDGDKVFSRETLTGHSGEGIGVHIHEQNELTGALALIAQQLDNLGFNNIARRVEDEMTDTLPELPHAELYTRGVKNHGEYRVHVMDEEVILYQKKSRRVDEDGNVVTAEGEAADVRNLASNWVYRTGNLKRLERVEQLAIDAIKSVGLTFGAVDIIMDEDGEVYVLEVNSAPGLGNTETLEAYTNGFNKFLNL